MTYFIDSLVEAISDFPSFHFRAYPISALSPWMASQKFDQPRVFWQKNGYFSLKVKSAYLMIFKVLNLISTSFLA